MSTEFKMAFVPERSLPYRASLLGSACTLTIAAAIGLAAPAAAKPRLNPKHEHAEHEAKAPFGNIPSGPLQLFVSLNNEQLHLYSGGTLIASAPVSTGVPAHPTPLGIFDVIQRDRFHRSNIYSNAPMPFMQRITWSGVALHEGEGVGHPASHGCIRMPGEFAARLWRLPTLGMRVVISRSELKPVDFADPHLFVHKVPAMASATPAAPPVKTAQTTDDGKTTDATPAPLHPSATDPAPPTPAAGAAADPPASASAAATAVPAVDAPSAAATADPPPAAGPSANKVATDFAATDTLRGTESNQSVPLIALEDAVPVPEAKPASLNESAAASHRRIAIFISRKTQRIYVRQNFTPLFDAPITVTDPQQPLGTFVFTAMDYQSDGTTFRWNVVELPGEQVRTVRVAERERGLDRHGRPLRGAERREQIVEPAPPPETPAQALARIEVPPDVIEQISNLMVPGSSLIVSDQGLGEETGEGTDFIVVTR